ncbi:LPS export ABC transporter periplasmic protein LptC [Congregibacter brevis]|uniref:LPS export ABC transporter periplasmic protein LptC n=1 Tax=Congregibacter brevis TaxID=3081201 RepID=A0ABZ0IJW7_9GAMM|nr:LPS export ABC transporter periplasmic protein LptC [Congregibacter sp. IMCC45268]
MSIPLLLCAGLLLYTLLAPTPRLITESAAPKTDARIPQSYAQDVSVNDFDVTGALQGNTQATSLRRFPSEGIIELDEPKRYNYTADGEWFASAQTGQLRETTEVLVLDQEVRLQYDTENVQFLTDRMIINMPKQAARSTASVRIWQADNETIADQIYINLSRQVASLSGAVRTVYVPEN